MTLQEIKDSVSIVSLLSRLGYDPVRKIGKEHQYFSMLHYETKPSFYVCDEIGAWYDHGLGQGGDVIKFGLAYWKLSFPETIVKIAETYGSQMPTHEPRRKRNAVKIPNYKIENIKELGNNPAITAYLKGRGVWQAAQGSLKEVYYYVDDQRKQRKYLFSAGWQNELDSWELRNRMFQTCLGHKAISFIPGSARLCLFEGYMDYLSWLTENPGADDSVIVLNSVALLPMAISKARDYNDIALYFDRDRAGQTATFVLMNTLPQAVDRSSIYEGYKDYNEKLVVDLQKQSIDLSR